MKKSRLAFEGVEPKLCPNYNPPPFSFLLRHSVFTIKNVKCTNLSLNCTAHSIFTRVYIYLITPGQDVEHSRRFLSNQ